METSRWQRQYIHLQPLVWGVSVVLATLLFAILMLVGWRAEVAGISFLVVFLVLRVALAYLLNNRFANSMVRVLKFDPAEAERDFRFVLKDLFVRYYHKPDEEGYRYVIPGHQLTMAVHPYWLSYESDKPVTKVTLQVVNTKNRAFAAKLAAAIDEMSDSPT